MTVASEINRSGPYNGNGVTTVFDYDFRILSDQHLRVVKEVDGVEATMALGADYIVSGVGNADGGSIATVVAPATGETITILLDVPFTQEMDLENQGAYFAETIEAAFDLAAMRDQQLQEQISRAVKIPASASPAELEELVGDVLRLAESADSIDLVAGSIASVNTAAANIAGVNTAAANIDAILAAPGYAAAAEAAAGSVQNPVSRVEPNLQTMAGPLAAPNLMSLTAPVQQRILRFDKYRSIHPTDEAAFDAIVRDAFSTSAIDTYGAFIDFCGFTITLTPRDIAVITGRTSNFKNITFANGTFLPDVSGTAWDQGSGVIRNCTITQFSNVVETNDTNNLKVGMCLKGSSNTHIDAEGGDGIPRETYITEIIDATKFRISTYAYRTRTKFYNIRHHKYFFDFMGFATASRIRFVNINWRCEGVASCIRMGASGIDWVIMNTFALAVGDRWVTDWAFCASGALIIGNVAWSSDTTETRTQIALTCNDNDVKIYFNRLINFRHSFVGHGSGYTIVGNHNWQGGSTAYKRQAAYVHTNPWCFTTYTGNYIDNGGIEVTNENQSKGGNGFNSLTITGNIFTMNPSAAPESRYIFLTIMAYNADTATKSIDGMTVTGNVFRRLVGGEGGVLPIPRVDDVFSPSGAGGLNPDAVNLLEWSGNTYHSITHKTANPCRLAQTQATAVDTWNFAFANKLPFGLKPKSVISTQAGGLLGMKTAADALAYQAHTTYVTGTDTTIACRFATAVKGTVTMTVDASTNT